MYDVRGFLEKSRHSLPLDVVELVKLSSNTLIASLFKEESDSFLGTASDDNKRATINPRKKKRKKKLFYFILFCFVLFCLFF